MASTTARDGRLSRIWAQVWRVLLCEVWVLLWGLVILAIRVEMGDQALFPPVWIAVDLVVGAVFGVLVVWRHRRPFLLLGLVSVLGIVSVSSFPAFLALILAAAARRRFWPLVWFGLLGQVTSVVSERWIQPRIAPNLITPPTFWGMVTTFALSVVFYVAICAIGWNRGAKRELHESWRIAAESARRDQVARVAQAQLAERSRIAREMHDVLAHKISLVSLHAGVLAYKDDLTPEESRQTATIIRDTAHQALEELREVLGVLRSDDYEALAPPQTTVLDLPRLVAEEEAAGAQITLDVEDDFWPRTANLSPSTSRHAERIVRECLTNAHKHAAGRPVLVKVRGSEDEGLLLLVRNELGGRTTTPGAGLGLEGLRERAALAGGQLEVTREDEHFEVRATLPWNARIGS